MPDAKPSTLDRWYRRTSAEIEEARALAEQLGRDAYNRATSLGQGVAAPTLKALEAIGRAELQARQLEAEQAAAVTRRVVRGPQGGQRFPQQVSGAFGDFVSNYGDMRDANTRGGDKYFHCKANCEASQRGIYGQGVAQRMSNLREITDQRIKGDPRSASLADQRANLVGRGGGSGFPSRPCSETCASVRPRGLPSRY